MYLYFYIVHFVSPHNAKGGGCDIGCSSSQLKVSSKEHQHRNLIKVNPHGSNMQYKVMYCGISNPKSGRGHVLNCSLAPWCYLQDMIGLET